MSKYHAIVTFTLGKSYEKEHKHNPKKKYAGECPLSGLFYARFCSDVTGAHHSTLVDGETVKEVMKKIKDYAKDLKYRVTRIEFIP